MGDLNNSVNPHNSRSLRAVLYFAVFLIVLGLGNIFFAVSRVQIYDEVYRKLQALNVNTAEKADGNEFSDSDSQEAIDAMTAPLFKKLDDERLDVRIKRAKARLEFYRFVTLGGKCLLVLSALLILYCLYYSKEFERKQA